MAFKKNTAVTGLTFVLADKSTGAAITTGTVSGFVTIDGGTQAAIGGTPIHEGNGQWSVNLTAGEMNGSIVGLVFTHASTVPLGITIRPEGMDPDATTVTVAGFSAGAITAAAFTAGAIDAAAIATDAIGSAELAATAVSEIVAGVWDELRSSHVTAGTFGQGAASVQGNVTGSVASVTGAVGSVTGAVGSVTATVTVGAFSAGAITAASFTAGAIDANVLASSAITSAKIAVDAIGGVQFAATAIQEITNGVWEEARISHGVAGTFGQGVASVQGNVTGSVASVTGAVTVGTNNDKTAYALSATGLDSIPTTAPTGPAATFREMVVQNWRRFFKKSTLTATQLKTYADDGTTVVTTQTVSDDATTQTQGTSA